MVELACDDEGTNERRGKERGNGRGEKVKSDCRRLLSRQSVYGHNARRAWALTGEVEGI
jgi:hypothetical protein